MENVEDESDQGHQLTVRRPFVGKFMRQLNFHQNEKAKRARRRQKTTIKRASQMIAEKILSLDLGPSCYQLLPCTHKNGDVIYANWKNDQIHGRAEIHHRNGTVFRGWYQHGVKTNGHFVFPNGFEYNGNCQANKFSGDGTLLFPSGKKITGEWHQHDIIGKGKIQYANGDVYFGQIQLLQKHGQGYLFFADGSKYEGQFHKGQITGKGKYFVENKIDCEGTWLNGELITGMTNSSKKIGKSMKQIEQKSPQGQQKSIQGCQQAKEIQSMSLQLDL